jgi:hypothetical protein
VSRSRLRYRRLVPYSCAGRWGLWHFLALLTIGCRTLDRFEIQRLYLFSTGILVGFLPNARELGAPISPDPIPQPATGT